MEHPNLPFVSRRIGSRKAWTRAALIPLALLGAILCVNATLARAQQPIRAQSAYAAPLPGETLDALTSPVVAISSDGSRVVFVAASSGGGRQLYLRSTRDKKATPLPNTEGAENPVFSPDGKWIAFFAFGKKLNKVPVNGGPVVTLCEITQPRGLSWGTGDRLVFTPALSTGLMEISSSGGTPQPLTKLNGERSHRWPELLPDGKTVLFATPKGGTDAEAQIVAERVGTGQRGVLIASGTQPRFSAGHLLYVHGGSLLAAPFDPARLELTGKPVKVLDHVQLGARTGAAHYAVSAQGTLVYVVDPGGAGQNSLLWVNRDGSATPLAAPQRPYEHPRISPDGKRVVFSTTDAKVFVYDLDRNESKQLTSDGQNQFPIWTPDGKRVAYLSYRNAARNVWWMPADGSSGPAEQLTQSKDLNEPSGWSSDGRLLLITDQAPETNRNILLLRVGPAANRERTAEAFLQTKVDESAARFSPDGRWVVYYSNETGKSEIYVKAFPPAAERWKISAAGGSEPVWSPGGNEIFYRNGDKMMSVEVKTTPGFAASTPRLLFEGNYRHGVTYRPDYDVTPDGKRFLMVRGSEQPPVAAQITVVPNWVEKANQQK